MRSRLPPCSSVVPRLGWTEKRCSVRKAHRVEQFLEHDLWTIDLHQRDRLHRLGIQTLRLAFAVASEFRSRLLDARAAGLVYTTLLSLVPFLAVMFSVLKAFGVHHRIEPVL